MADYDLTAAFESIENELIDSMMRNFKRHRAEETELGYNWSQWQAEQLKALEVYRKHNSKRFSKRFSELNGKVAEMLREARADGSADQEAEILEAIRNGFKAPRKPPKASTAEFFKTNDRKLGALIKATTNDLRKAEHATLRRANDKYRKAIYSAQVYANTGAATYEKAVDMACRDMLRAGLDSIEYKNGARHTLADYADMAIKTANKRASLSGEGAKRAEWGISTVIINRRRGGCPKCAKFIGKVYIDDVWSGGKKSNGSYPLLSSAIEAGLYHPRCKDSHSTYYEGITEAKPLSREEIAQLEQNEQLEQQEGYYRNQAKKNGRIAGFSLDPENKKLYSQRAAAAEKKAEEMRHKMASGVSENDWTDTVSTKYTKEERAELIEYAEEHGVKIHGIKDFDGDSKLLKEQIDTISSISKEFKLKKKVTIKFDDLSEDDFAETSGSTITFNKPVLRNREITERNLSSGGFASSKAKGIAAHEMGHIISRQYGEKGIEIARKAYYNIKKENLTESQILLYLNDEISPYSVKISNEKIGKPFKNKYYVEVIPEIFAKSISDLNQFTNEFIKILQEVYRL